MMLMLLSTLVAIASAQTSTHDHGAHMANQHAMLVQLKHSFQHLDTDHDGSYSLAESLASFDHSDTNSDGMIDPQEFSVSERHTNGPRDLTDDQIMHLFHFYDSMHFTKAMDGFISRADEEAFFHELDANNDGGVTQTEYVDALDSMEEDILGHLIDHAAAHSTAATAP